MEPGSCFKKQKGALDTDVGIIIAILSVSGAAALFKDEFDHLLNPRLHYVTERGPHVSLTATAQRLQAANPDYNFQ